MFNNPANNSGNNFNPCPDAHLLVKLNQSLNAKENKKGEDRSTLFTSEFGRNLTDSEVTDQFIVQNQRMEAKVAKKLRGSQAMKQLRLSGKVLLQSMQRQWWTGKRM